MRLWSIDFSYLDSKGLTACWRESLLARAVLEGKTEGYRNHPQLQRFRMQENPIVAINTYLHYLYAESASRGFVFNPNKIKEELVDIRLKIPVTRGQLLYEFGRIKEKLSARDTAAFSKIAAISNPKANQMFYEIPGGIEPWEKVR
ncbi:MAG: pyrimidine dimer DNA glycosylase/endonuclease V [Candidatus Micrarchaeaceae archaeon]